MQTPVEVQARGRDQIIEQIGTERSCQDVVPIGLIPERGVFCGRLGGLRTEAPWRRPVRSDIISDFAIAIVPDSTSASSTFSKPTNGRAVVEAILTDIVPIRLFDSLMKRPEVCKLRTSETASASNNLQSQANTP